MALTLAVLGSAGCSGSGDDDAVQSTTTTDSTTTTAAPEESETEAVVAAFEEAVFAAIRAGMVPDPTDPALVETHTGPMLEQAQDTLRGYQLRGIVFRYPEPVESGFHFTVDPSSIELTDDTAVFEACAVDEGERVYAETGEPVSQEAASGASRVRVGMRFVDGTWKLAERRNLESFEDAEACAA